MNIEDTEAIKEVLQQGEIPFEETGGKIVVKGGCVYLRSLTTLPRGVEFRNGGYLDLNSLTTLPRGVEFRNGGYVGLHSLTTLPRGVEFRNGGYVGLHSLTTGQSYQGVPVEIVDGYTMLVDSVKTVDGMTIKRCRYLCGSKAEVSKCYVAQSGEFSAHGRTIQEAVEDLRFKLDRDRDLAETVDEIKKSGYVTVNQYRAITGACQEGCRQFVDQHGISEEKIPLSRVLELTRGAYGDETFAEKFA